MRKIRLSLVLSFLILFGSLCSYGQTTAGSQISGTITDLSGAVLPGVIVVTTQMNSGFTRTTVSSACGGFTFPDLRVGPYKLDVTAAGFSHFERTGIILELNTNPTDNIGLKPGAVSTNVVVNANAAQVETQPNSISNVVDHRHIVDLLDSRNMANLILLTGVSANGVASGNDLIGSKNYGNGARDSPLILSVAGMQSNSWMDEISNNAFTNMELLFPLPGRSPEI